MSEDAELPKALVKKIAKSKLTNLEISRIEKLDAEKKEGKEAKARDIQISKDALLALGESARVFIHYLTATGIFDLTIIKNLAYSYCKHLTLCLIANGQGLCFNTTKIGQPIQSIIVNLLLLCYCHRSHIFFVSSPEGFWCAVWKIA